MRVIPSVVEESPYLARGMLRQAQHDSTCLLQLAQNGGQIVFIHL